MEFAVALFSIALGFLKVAAIGGFIFGIWYFVRSQKLINLTLNTAKEECSVQATQIVDFIDYRHRLTSENAQLDEENDKYRKILDKIKDDEDVEIDYLIESLLESEDTDLESLID